MGRAYTVMQAMDPVKEHGRANKIIYSTSGSKYLRVTSFYFLVLTN
jgi:hypothetical protein